jgi:predicted O-methyltransferase YrrM
LERRLPTLKNARWWVSNGYRCLRQGWASRARADQNENKAAMAALLSVYAARPDLQEVYPEAEQGDLGRLVNWATGVSYGRWNDSSYNALKPYAAAYAAAPSIPPEAAPAPWGTAVRTSQAGDNALPVTFEVMQQRTAADISNHLMTLCLLVREFGLKNIVELGTRDGNSTLALLEAGRAIAAHVTSVDVEPCAEASRRVQSAGLSEHWTFLQADDMQLQPPAIPLPIDLLFIDTSHLYGPTLAELKKYSAYLRDGSWIALHDYVSFAGVNRAVHDFVGSTPSRLRFYSFMHQNGLALLRWQQRA